MRGAGWAFAACMMLMARASAEPLAGWPDTSHARLAALALVQTLNANLLAGRSATLTLEKWCADHRMAAEPKIVARRTPGVDKPASDEQRRRLRVDANEPIKYRRVQLVCGPHILSEADNWYVPARLTPEMNRVLETTDMPFGKVVQPLKPFRQTFGVRTLWAPLPDGWESARPDPGSDGCERPLVPPRAVFEHRAVLYGADQQPFSEVAETYTSEILDFEPPGVRARCP
jgi:hypothetical protein